MHQFRFPISMAGNAPEYRQIHLQVRLQQREHTPGKAEAQSFDSNQARRFRAVTQESASHRQCDEEEVAESGQDPQHATANRQKAVCCQGRQDIDTAGRVPSPACCSDNISGRSHHGRNTSFPESRKERRIHHLAA